MKQLIFLSFVLVFFLNSCGNKGAKNDSSNETESTVEEMSDNGNLKKADNCDEFIDQYEKWMDDYLKLLEKYMKNPMDAALSQQYMTLAQEAMNWYEQWGKLATCASNDKYQKRFDEIAEKADKKMKELGLD